MPKFITHYWSVTIFNNGRFCWENAGWTEKSIEDYKRGDAWLIGGIVFFATIHLLT